MIRASAIIPPADVRPDESKRFVTLTREERYRRRIVMTTDCGFQFLLDLPQAVYLPDGSGLLLETGDFVRVRAAAEPLLEIRAGDTALLMRLAWHIGNRHTPAEVATDALYIQADHVLAEMVRGLGGVVSEVTRPFEPEGGAYGGHGALTSGHHRHGNAANGHHEH
ncbi:MAG: urease accessory protein UreE [Hyphomicrobiales bacterium]|nr:urease accessory protein UreE [Hyphomicrobiales bacterium]